ncbi:flagellar biosynthesis protein FlhF [Clostridium botulinum]|uniref:Flagellar biosynthesis protein FlhF n=1 Tax=Clostridium botulinum (strain Hall / ATCC 3502 / NCTC 13319 / Type A) TaxID=441771 RepID=A5I578_CLOBH|nr:flagellar biosynthesis protein FlhF [Clostridium botulinum]ABS35091.1 flagellar biosynthesis protein FlhF [Clostridium botulinum A str. ATCC 19397]ABS37126.1 flagellar biosynthesis protein FlhF [Clostridium botulinum A str. Hall]APQ98532.1 flagellar biosynthesis protein FlhF [Clostridium botulinum]AWB18432.1 flagellar biosynthesis protein FlhF [Clostridium botulinum]AWB31206.1 flagellar biosynthesis protein FlhF [Clostridium botulinum]
MKIKKYVVNDMNEAMTRIRYELGADAIIISQRKIRKGGFLGLFSKKSLEVTAAIDNYSTEKKYNSNTVNKINKGNNIEVIKRMLEERNNNVKYDNNINHDTNALDRYKEILESKSEGAQNKSLKGKKFSESKDLMDEIRDLKKIVKDIGKSEKSYADENSSLVKFFKDLDLEEEFIEEIIKKVGNLEENLEEREKIKRVIEDTIDVRVNSVGKVTVLVGPTGVGKTTTIAKLAGKLSLIDKKKVGLITIDTYRIGAVEQLKTYADIMNIPFKVVFSIKDMEKAIIDLDYCDVILVDTTGRSSKNMMQISELRAFIEKIKEKSVHLVISASTKNKDIETIVKGYSILEYENIIITKLDETSIYGSILTILDKGKNPISFITTGQDVPDDIKEGNKEEIAKIVLGENKLC